MPYRKRSRAMARIATSGQPRMRVSPKCQYAATPSIMKKMPLRTFGIATGAMPLPRGRGAYFTSSVLDDDVRELRRHVALRVGDLDRAAARDLLVDRRDLAVGVGHDRGLARIGLAADRLVEREL